MKREIGISAVAVTKKPAMKELRLAEG